MDLETKEFADTLVGIKTSTEEVQKNYKDLQKELGDTKEALEALKKENGEFAENIKKLEKSRLSAQQRIVTPKRRGLVSDNCAKHVAAVWLVGAAKHGAAVKPKMLKWAQDWINDEVDINQREPNYDDLDHFRKGVIGKSALTTSDIPMPTGYSGEIVELVETFGSFRRYATVFPMGDGTVNLPKLTTDPAFGFIDTSGSVGEKSPQIAMVEFAAKKAGGLVRVPHEIDADSIVPLGQFLARYIARQFASWEDVTGWLADGSGTYKTLEGVVDRVGDNSKLVTLTSTNTSPDDIALADLRSVRALPNSAILEQDPAYYMHPTMEAKLSGFNTNGDKPYMPVGANGPTLDGFPIRWVNKLQAYITGAAASTTPVIFGDMSYWYMGVRGGVRVDVSPHVFFGTDEVGIRGLERFTIGEMATDHVSGIKTAAS